MVGGAVAKEGANEDCMEIDRNNVSCLLISRLSMSSPVIIQAEIYLHPTHDGWLCAVRVCNSQIVLGILDYWKMQMWIIIRGDVLRV